MNKIKSYILKNSSDNTNLTSLKNSNFIKASNIKLNAYKNTQSEKKILNQSEFKEQQSFVNIGIGITGSFCTFDKILSVITNLVEKGYNIIPIITEKVKTTSTRFGSAENFITKLKNITKNEVVDSLTTAEPIGPKNLIDILLIAPCTGNTIAKLSNAITDNAVNMVFKSHIRNNKPVVIGISTNDALGLNFVNIATLLNTKNIYFVPFGQDDYIKKPKSMICKWDLIEDALISAWQGKQLQPLLLRGD